MISAPQNIPVFQKQCRELTEKQQSYRIFGMAAAVIL